MIGKEGEMQQETQRLDDMGASVCLCVCCVHKADDEQQFGHTVQSQASWQVMVFWTLVSSLRGAHHLFDPLNHFLVCRRGNRAEGLVQMLAAYVREWPLFPPDRGVLHNLGLRRELVGLRDDLFQLRQLHL